MASALQYEPNAVCRVVRTRIGKELRQGDREKEKAKVAQRLDRALSALQRVTKG